MLIAGNWKMNTDVDTGRALASEIARGLSETPDAFTGVALAVAPPFVSLHAVRDALADTTVALSAQTMHAEVSGAYTGDVSAPMLASVGCSHVILGHSERRQYHGTTDADVNARVQRAHAQGLVPIVCVGETLSERRAGDAEAVVRAQLAGALADAEVDAADQLVLAYEPVWAIGTGETATPEQAQEMHAFIRSDLAERFGANVGASVHILYGGSMKPHNCEGLLRQSDINGGLVGGASLDADSFLAIARHAATIQALA
jgi:triosephosphate isomerase